MFGACLPNNLIGDSKRETKNKCYTNVGLYITWLKENDKVEYIEYPREWCAGATAIHLSCLESADEIYMLGFDLSIYDEPINNIYKGTKGYTYIKRPVDPSYWIYQFNKLFQHSDCRWIIVNKEKWKMPDEWKENKNVFQDTYEGLAKWINRQMNKKDE